MGKNTTNMVNKTPSTRVVAWKKKFVTALHEYAYSLWKKWNMFVYRDNLKGNRKRQYALCQERVKQIYKMNRSILSQNERDIFKLPLAIRLKQGLDGMVIWIEMTEVLFDNALKKQGKKLENLMFRRKKKTLIIKVKRRKPRLARTKQKKKEGK